MPRRLVPGRLHSDNGHAIAGPGCDLVAPLSTVHGKGYAKQEGIENVLKLSALASAWVNQVHNFGRVQAVLASVPAARDTLVIDMAKLHNGGFSGVL